MNRRDFIVLLGTAVYSNHGFAEEPRRQHKLAIIHPSTNVDEMREAGVNPNWHAFFTELRRLGYIEGGNLTVHRYSAGGRDVYRESATSPRTIADLASNARARQVYRDLPSSGLGFLPIALTLTLVAGSAFGLATHTRTRGRVRGALNVFHAIKPLSVSEAPDPTDS